MRNIIEYKEDYGKIAFPEGFSEKLRGKSLEEQMEYYRITQSASLASTAYGEVTSEQKRSRTWKLDAYPEWTGLVVKEGMIVGVLIREYFSQRDTVCLPYQSVCTYYASDNEGSGTEDREDRAFLICV